MKPFLLAASILATTATAGMADGLYWVVGNRATSRCEIVTSNPGHIGRYLVLGRPVQITRRGETSSLDHRRVSETRSRSR